MILLVHMLFGAAIGSLASNITLGIALAFLGHYFLDLFPHIEYLNGVEASIEKLKISSWQKNAINIAAVFLDFFLGAAIIFLISPLNLLLYVYAFAAIIPDGLTIVHSLFPNLGLGLHHKIHGQHIHYLTKQKKFPKFWRIATQVAALIVSIIILKS